MKAHLQLAIRRLSDYLSYEGCNDYEMPDTPENRALYDEAQAWNLGVSLADLKAHPDYHEPHVIKVALLGSKPGNLMVNDSILVYVLRKATGLLDRDALKD